MKKTRKEVLKIAGVIAVVLATSALVAMITIGIISLYTNDKSGVYLLSAQELLEIDKPLRVRLEVVMDLVEFIADVRIRKNQYQKTLLINNSSWDKTNEKKFRMKMVSYKILMSKIRETRKDLAQVTDYRLVLLIEDWLKDLEKLEKIQYVRNL